MVMLHEYIEKRFDLFINKITLLSIFLSFIYIEKKFGLSINKITLILFLRFFFFFGSVQNLLKGLQFTPYALQLVFFFFFNYIPLLIVNRKIKNPPLTSSINYHET